MYEEKCYQMIHEMISPENLSNWNGIPTYGVGVFSNHEILQEVLWRYGWAQKVVRHYNSRNKLDSFTEISTESPRF